MTGTAPLPPLWSGLAGLSLQEPFLRWGLVALALAWAVVAVRGRGLRTLLAGVLFAELALGFWATSLGRPYGLLEHPGVTREAASAALLVARGAPDGIVPDTPFVGGPWARLAGLGLPEPLLVDLPTLLPLLVLPLSALLIHGVWRGATAPLAALLWLAFSSGALDALRGAAFVPGLWAHPAASLGLLLALASLFAADRARRASARLVLGLPGLAGLALALAGPAEPLGLVSAVLLATLDQWPWWLLALPAWRHAGGLPRALVVGGAALLAAIGLGAPLDAWGAQALLRLGLLLLGSHTLGRVLPALGGPLAAALARGQRRAAWLLGQGRPADLALGALLACTVPGSFLAWWPPLKLDPAAHASLTPPPAGLVQAMQWARTHTSAEAVFVTAEAWAAAVPVLGARRVLRAPALVESHDDARRARLTYLAVAGHGPKGWRNARRYGLSHLLLAPGDLENLGLDPSRPFAAHDRWRLCFEGHGGFRVYELIQWQAAGPEAPLG